MKLMLEPLGCIVVMRTTRRDWKEMECKFQADVAADVDFLHNGGACVGTGTIGDSKRELNTRASPLPVIKSGH
jgi:hypothetical protein